MQTFRYEVLLSVMFSIPQLDLVCWVQLPSHPLHFGDFNVSPSL